MRDGVANGIAFDDEGNGPPIIFLHGMSWDRRIWQPIIARLSDRFRCVSVDLPGHGKSDDLPKTRDYQLDAVAARLHRLFLTLEIEKPVLVGHSLGGAIASFYAAQFPVRGTIKGRTDRLASRQRREESLRAKNYHRRRREESLSH